MRNGRGNVETGGVEEEEEKDLRENGGEVLQGASYGGKGGARHGHRLGRV